MTLTLYTHPMSRGRMALYHALLLGTVFVVWHLLDLTAGTVNPAGGADPRERHPQQRSTGLTSDPARGLRDQLHLVAGL